MSSHRYTNFKMHSNFYLLSWVAIVSFLSSGATKFSEKKLFVYPEFYNNTEIDSFSARNFPTNFNFGVSTSAYQIEGAWNIDGKSDSIWDNYTHRPDYSLLENGDHTTESYFLWQTDVDLLKQLGVQFYRFSISWSRVLPKGVIEDFESDVNSAGVKYYNDLIDALVAANIEPLVTLVHYDPPQILETQGGFLSDDFPQWYEDYASFCFQTFGDRVKNWLSFNEPYISALCYEGGLFTCAPGEIKSGIWSYRAAHNLILAHSRAYQKYKSQFRKTQKGKFGIVLYANWQEPKNQSELNLNAANKWFQFTIGWFLSPLLLTGDYPQVMKNSVATQSKLQGFSKSRLPEFTETEKQMNLGSLDFVGINYYGGFIVENMDQVYSAEPSISNDLSVKAYFPENWIQSKLVPVFPYGLRKLLNLMMKIYGKSKENFEMMVTENGLAIGDNEASSYPCEDSFDLERMQYIVSHLDQLYKSIVEDKIPVTLYSIWSLMDNYNFGAGFDIKFGLFCVDFDSKSKFRFARYSAQIFREVIDRNGFDQELVEALLSLGVLTELN